MSYQDTGAMAYEDRYRTRVLANLQRRAKTLGFELAPMPAAEAVSLEGSSALRGPKAMTFQFIARYRGSLSPSHLCRMMGVSDRGLRAWRRRPPSIRQPRDMVIQAHIRDQHRLGLGSYGRPRMTEELKELGLRVGQGRVGRLMRQNGIRIVRSRKFKHTTDSDYAFNTAPNLLQQDFSASGANRKWAGDISYVWTRGGWVYLAVIIDLFSRRVIGWAISNRMKQDLAIRALNMAVALRRPPQGGSHHTDRGSQDCGHDDQKSCAGRSAPCRWAARVIVTIAPLSKASSNR